MRKSAGMPGGKRHCVAAWFAIIGMLAVPVVQAQVKNEALVSSQSDLIDSEYSQSRATIAWCDAAGGLWIAGIDRDTGMFVPSDGKGLLVDPSAMRIDDLKVVGNGPEWVSTADGDQIVYTKFPPDQPHSMQNAKLALAEQSGSGDWSYHYLLPLDRRGGPYASHDPGDPSPRISYFDSNGRHYWRDLNDPSSETPLPMPRSRLSTRCVEGTRAVVFTAPVAGTSQVFFHWLDTGTTSQVTFDPGDKDLHTVPWSWKAPEFGGDLVIATVVDDTELRIYRQSPATGWSLVQSMRTPLQGVINSPEPFVHAGKSFMVFSASTPPGTQPTAVFMARIDPAAPLLWQLTPDLPRRIRRDPEVFVTSSGPYVYFNRLTFGGGGTSCVPCNEGVFRSYTGLPPAAK
jgi:hypothetical protein